MKPRVAWLATDFTMIGHAVVPGGCSYYRCFLPMHMCGFPSEFGPPAFDAMHGFGVRENNTHARFGHKVVVLKLLMERWIPKQIELAKRVGQKIVVDIDDFYPGLDPANQAYAATDPQRFKARNRDIYQRVIEMADMLVVTTPFLYDYYKNVNSNIVMVRNGVSPVQFVRKQVTTKRPVIGWVGAVPWRSNDLEPLADWLPDFLVRNNLHFHHAGVAPGAQSLHEIVGIPEERFSSQGMVPMDRYGELFPQIDIGIVPLADIPFNHAKSTIKGLEYTASGVPFVAAGLPEYQRLADMGVGRTANSPVEWQQQLGELLNSRVRAREEERNWGLMLRDHAVDCRRQEWERVIEMALEVPSKAVAA